MLMPEVDPEHVKMAPLISIIVPVYNMERYLRQCLDSIKKQTMAEWECILVDDGSSDSSPEICEEYAKEDSRFKVIHEPNSGLSVALNTGMEASEGEFIGFVDADDWIEPEMFRSLYVNLKNHDADMSQCGYIKEYRGRRSKKPIVAETKILTGSETMHAIGIGIMPSYKCIRLHRRNIITVHFPEGRNFEDIFAYGEWLKNVKRMVACPEPLYHYRMRKGSIAHSDMARNRVDYFLSCIDTMKMLEDAGNITTTDERNAYINKAAVRAAKLIARKEKNKEKRIEGIRKISDLLCDYPLPSKSIIGRKNYKRASLLRKSPEKFSQKMRLVNLFDLDPILRESRFFE